MRDYTATIARLGTRIRELETRLEHETCAGYARIGTRLEIENAQLTLDALKLSMLLPSRCT